MICINWDGFPQYAARCVRALVQALGDEKVVVLARRPTVPIQGMEDLCGCPVVWIERNESRGVADLCGEMPRYMCVSGWFDPLYNRWRDEVRASGGHVSCACDNNYVLDALGVNGRGCAMLSKELLRMLRFKWRVRGKYDSFFVPGKSGRKLLRFYGVPDKLIFEGMYAADSSLFQRGPSLGRRKKKILYVGQFIERKNVLRLVSAFTSANEHGDWSLELYGSGPLRAKLMEVARGSGGSVLVHDFLQPEELAAKYREARLFCLPSLREHWGLVVHEAALSGCALLLGKYTGASADFMDDSNESHGFGKFANGILFDPYNEKALRDAITRGMEMSDDEMSQAFEASARLAEAHGIEQYVASVLSMMNRRGRA